MQDRFCLILENGKACLNADKLLITYSVRPLVGTIPCWTQLESPVALFLIPLPSASVLVEGGSEVDGVTTAVGALVVGHTGHDLVVLPTQNTIDKSNIAPKHRMKFFIFIFGLLRLGRVTAIIFIWVLYSDLKLLYNYIIVCQVFYDEYFILDFSRYFTIITCDF